MIKIICISVIINIPSFITAGLITHDLIYEMVYLYAKFLELLIHRLGLGGPQCVVLRISECFCMVCNVNKFQKVKQKGAFDDDF